MRSQTARLALTMGITAIALTLAACGGDQEAEPPSSSSSSAPAAKAKPGTTVKQISADAQKCLDLVRAKQYTQAIDPCERAIAATATAELDEAYAEAKAAVEQAAKAAAMQAASESIQGKPPEDAARDAVKNFGQ